MASSTTFLKEFLAPDRVALAGLFHRLAHLGCRRYVSPAGQCPDLGIINARVPVNQPILWEVANTNIPSTKRRRQQVLTLFPPSFFSLISSSLIPHREE